jgi:hypothetical protein
MKSNPILEEDVTPIHGYFTFHIPIALTQLRRSGMCAPGSMLEREGASPSLAELPANNGK